MIEINEIFSDSDKRMALWFDSAADTSDLVVMAENVVQEKVQLISVLPESVPFIWTCLEKQDVKIMTRYFFDPMPKNVDSYLTVSTPMIILHHSSRLFPSAQ